MKAIPFLMLLLLLEQASALDPPVMEWDRLYFSGCSPFFWDVQLVSEAGHLVSGRVGSSIHAFLIRTDQSGNILWTYGNDDWYYQEAYRTVVLPDGSLITTGSYRVSPSSSIGLFLSKVSSDGDEVWTNVYDFPGTTERGYSVTPLSDGGFCVTGVNYSGGEPQAWILRTNPEGDTLWTDSWGGSSSDYSKRALFMNEKIVVLASVCSSELPSNGPHLLFYDLDGQYLWGTDYPDLWGGGADMCLASDGGITFITGGGVIAHTDSLGNLLWSNAGTTTERGITITWCSLGPCMDGGYIVAGSYVNIWTPGAGLGTHQTIIDYAESETWGVLVRFDDMGNELWSMFVDPGGSDQVKLYSAHQLPEGGYVAVGYLNDLSGSTGINGYLVRYAPETGIGEWESSSGCPVSLSAWPNPSNGPVRISLNGPEGLYDLGIYDLQGRRVREYPEIPLGGGAMLLWDGCSESGASLPAGVYVARLIAVDGATSTHLMRL